ncbi:MAG TPA: prolyl oligopeptidase family serine peptidase [Sedimentisphaerales bacterium]|nr:prolyl oligopeptidase family serine peptidase [Sedimentisphaerales bacterium]
MRYGFPCRLKNVPVWAFHGAKDEIIPVNESEEMVAAVNACGGNAKLTVYPDAEHNAWTPTYRNKELYDWFLKHRKVTEHE